MPAARETSPKEPPAPEEGPGVGKLSRPHFLGSPRFLGAASTCRSAADPRLSPPRRLLESPRAFPGHRLLSAAVHCRCSSEPCLHPTRGQSRMTTSGAEACPGRGYPGSADPSPALQEPPGSALPSPSTFLAWRGCPPRTMQSGQPAPPAETGLRGLSCWSGGAPHQPQSTSCDHDALPQPHLWNRIYARLYPTEPLEVNLWRIFSRGKEMGHP